MKIIIEIFSVLLGLMVIPKTYLNFKSGKESITMFLFWSATWLLVILVSFFPSIVDKIISITHSEKIGIGTFLGMAMVFLFFVIYRVYIKADRIEKEMAKLIKENAQINANKKNANTNGGLK